MEREAIYGQGFAVLVDLREKAAQSNTENLARIRARSFYKLVINRGTIQNSKYPRVVKFSDRAAFMLYQELVSLGKPLLATQLKLMFRRQSENAKLATTGRNSNQETAELKNYSLSKYLSNGKDQETMIRHYAHILQRALAMSKKPGIDQPNLTLSHKVAFSCHQAMTAIGGKEFADSFINKLTRDTSLNYD